MHYHLPQHGEPRLRRAARSQHGETQLPSSKTLPEQVAPLPGTSAPVGEASSFERMQAELKAAQQQALATQQSLQQLEARKPVDAYAALTSNLPGLSMVDGAVLGVASALALAGLVIWWNIWRRPRNRWTDSGDTGMLAAGARGMPVPSTQSSATPTAPAKAQPSQAPHLDETQGWSASTASGEFSTHGFEPSSPFARQEPNMAFDSEAAASEVMRVRKSLAEKREARSNFLEREFAADVAQSHDPDLDLDLDLEEIHSPALHAWVENTVTQAPKPNPQAAAATQAEPQPELDLDLDLYPDPWLQSGETDPGTANAQSADAIHFSLPLEDYGVKPVSTPAPDAQPPNATAMDLTPEAAVEIATPPVRNPPAIQPEPAPELALAQELVQPQPMPGTKAYDYTVTMALAEESAALELWNEARDLAAEVLASDDAALVAKAQALLNQLNQLEQDAPPDTNWSTVR